MALVRLYLEVAEDEVTRSLIMVRACIAGARRGRRRCGGGVEAAAARVGAGTSASRNPAPTPDALRSPWRGVCVLHGGGHVRGPHPAKAAVRATTALLLQGSPIRYRDADLAQLHSRWHLPAGYSPLPIQKRRL